MSSSISNLPSKNTPSIRVFDAIFFVAASLFSIIALSLALVATVVLATLLVVIAVAAGLLLVVFVAAVAGIAIVGFLRFAARLVLLFGMVRFFPFVLRPL